MMASISVPCGVLPRWARNELVEAAHTPIPVDDPLARQREIEKTLDRLRALLPEYFRQEEA